VPLLAHHLFFVVDESHHVVVIMTEHLLSAKPSSKSANAKDASSETVAEPKMPPFLFDIVMNRYYEVGENLGKVCDLL